MNLKKLNRYRPFVKGAFREVFAYKWAIISWTTASVLSVVMKCCLWGAIYRFGQNDVIGGYTFPQMVAYLCVACITGQLCYTNTLDELSDVIISGEVGSKLIKPISFRIQLIARNIGNFGGTLIIMGAGMLIATFATLGLFFDYAFGWDLFWRIPVYLLSSFVSMLIMEAFCFIFGQVAFVSQAIFGLMQIVDTLWAFLSGALIPLSVFPEWARTALMCTPFPYYMSLPVSVLTGAEFCNVIVGIALQVVWLVLFWTIGNLLFARSVKRVVSFGG